ncbi:MAG: polysaccharide biosynthesis tyrosine autokinase [Cyanomargarita calcarea GSE-NOS-MK-12-04C]|jgi:capsular exopolysaccharide synthesis family protein|uniref:non-specific protein-tyrosine kinase n=1 Tax=Cyanomargarita calcarea GSE-NOS-MK-12-04C TaxID=2839659 RepID=A0A951UTH0_9CYAN|nr:polysaccharide biosynthesis tyrosine autokinase [Cyanomargarita calcarea GSE-NOS-MK-12-04C]
MQPQEHFDFEEIDFQKYWLVLQRRWIPATGVFSVIFTMASVFALSLKPTYKADGSVLIKVNRSSLTGLEENIGRIDPALQTNNPTDTQAKIVASVPVIEETINSLHLKDKQGKAIKIRDLTKKLKVESTKGTDVVEISYSDSDPKQAAKVVNKIIEIYIRNNINANRAEAVSVRKFIGKQLPSSEAAVKQAESFLRKFKEENKVIVLAEEATAAVKTISQLEDQIAQAQAQLVDATGREAKLLKEVNVDSQQAVAFTQLSQTPGVQKVLAQLQEAQSLLAVEQTRLQPGHPSIISLNEKVTALNSLLQVRVQEVAGSNEQVRVGNLQIGELRQSLIADIVRVQAERIGLERQVTELSNMRTAYKERANILPRLEQNQRELERQMKAAQTTYETLLTRLQEIKVAENQNIGNASVISKALVPDQPVGLGKKVVLAGGGVVGILLGITAAFAIDLIDRSLKTVREAREIFQYTLLGVIPLLSRDSKNSGDPSIPKVIGRDIPHYPLGDAYQMLQANLKFLSSDKKLKSIVVTSSVSKEGKSEVAANLAVSMAQVGNRVLLVDANMRHSVQHHIWNLTNTVGLSNLIVDQVALDAAVHQVMPNLDVLLAGVVPPNPVALLDSNRMASLVTTFVNNYDFVIFDTPALAGTADAAVLGKLVDGILLVVRPGVVNSASAQAAKEFLTQSGQQVLGMAINGVNVKREPDSYFYYTQKQVETGSKSKKSINIKSTSSEVSK